MNNPGQPDTLQLSLNQLNASQADSASLKADSAALKASNEALLANLAEQENRHAQQMSELRQELDTIKSRSAHATTSDATRTNTEGEQVRSEKSSGNGSTPATTQSTSPVRAKSERLPDPPAFSGKKKDLPLFITKLRYKLKGNSDRFPDEESRLIYAHSRLEHDPATLVDPLMSKDISTVEQLIEFLKATYGDPNRELTAWSRLDNMKQGKKNFLSHFAEFRRLVADTNLNEGAQIN